MLKTLWGSFEHLRTNVQKSRALAALRIIAVANGPQRGGYPAEPSRRPVGVGYENA
jgi:hypothetical protein